MDLTPERLHRTILDIVAELQQDRGLAAEVLRAERQFYGGSPDAYVPEGAARATAHGRFAEWFVLERESEHLGAVPVEAIGGLPDLVRDALQGSLCGLFVVEVVAPEVRVRDVLSGDRLELVTDADLEPGDVVVGRLYPAAMDAVTPSPAAAILRQGQDVTAALQRDFARAGLDRRLTQAELEALLFRSASELSAARARRVPPERLEARLDSLLRAGGDDSLAAEQISAALEAAVEGPGPVMGPLLDALAFETDVDLDAVRTVMLELWNEHRLRAQERSPAPPQPPAAAVPAQPGLGATIAARIERGLAAHEDIEALFADVEGMLGEASEEDEEEDEEAADCPDGDLEPLVAEYLWERQHDSGSTAAEVLHTFAAHQRQLPVPGVYLEAIPARELVNFLLRAYLAAPPRQRAERVQAQFDALRDFYAWAADTQGYEVETPIAECGQTLIGPLARLQRASLALSTADAPVASLQPRVLRVARVEGGEIEVVGSGTEPTWIDAPQAAAELRADDLVLAAAVPDGRGGLRVEGPAVVLPAAAADLLE